MWVRDYGPFFLTQGKEGPASVIDYAYTQPNRDYGELFGTTFAGTFGYEFARAELSFEGGNLLTNGDGLCVTTNTIAAQNASRGYDETQIGNVLANNSIQTMDASQAARRRTDRPRGYVLHDLRHKPGHCRQLHARAGCDQRRYPRR